MSKAATILTLTAATGILLAYAAHRQRTEPPVITLGALPFGFNAITVPPVGILVRSDQANNQYLLEHERIHWGQFQQRGLMGFYRDYLGQLFTYGYDQMPMEVEARVIEDPHCQCHYTECVRTGIAKTVQNPKFRAT